MNSGLPILSSKKGKVIGIDITAKMLEKAKDNAKKYGYKM
jgi:ubiquinone/menaquinone biosynthesis C-methylase UbiE